MPQRKVPLITITSAIVLVLAWVGVLMVSGAAPSLAQARPPGSQLSQDFPNFTLSPVAVTGGVAVTNNPTVYARQADAWTVSLAGQPVFSTPTPQFLVAGGTYAFLWLGAAEADFYRVTAIANDGWIRAEPLPAGPDQRARWVNSALAVTIEEVALRR